MLFDACAVAGLSGLRSVNSVPHILNNIVIDPPIKNCRTSGIAKCSTGVSLGYVKAVSGIYEQLLLSVTSHTQ